CQGLESIAHSVWSPKIRISAGGVTKGNTTAIGVVDGVSGGRLVLADGTVNGQRVNAPLIGVPPIAGCAQFAVSPRRITTVHGASKGHGVGANTTRDRKLGHRSSGVSRIAIMRD